MADKASEGTVQYLESVADARRLADRLLAPDRTRPVVVVSTSSGQDRPWIDAERVKEHVGDLAEIYVLPTGELSWELSDQLPGNTGVYGGAARVYPVDVSWTSDQYRSPLRLAYSAADGERATESVVADALRMVAAAGLLEVSRATAREVEGTVKLIAPESRAVVAITGGGHASVWQELTYPEVPLTRVLRQGMRVRGLLDPDQGRLDLRPYLPDGKELVRTSYESGDVVLAQVRDVAASRATLLVQPEVAVPMTRDDVTGNPHDDISDLLTEGEIVAARVVGWTGGAPRLSLLDVDDDETPRPAVSLLPGGPPWLEETTDEDVPDVRPQPVARRQVAPSSRRRTPQRKELVQELELTLDAANARLGALTEERNRLEALANDLQIEKQDLTAELEATREDLAEAARDLARQRTNYRRADQRRQQVERQLRAARQQQDDRPADEDAFLDPEDQFRHEVYVSWVRRIPKSDKPERPLQDYALGPRFLASLDAVDGIERSKVVDVVVEVLTGLAEQLSGRELHQLRQGSGGDDPPVTREDGATCWRVALQRNTPAARRLHYWRRAGGDVELSRVVTHDDTEP
ncbi:MAG: hypothetical protein ACODAF_02845 [Actinomycetota bacterium]